MSSAPTQGAQLARDKSRHTSKVDVSVIIVNYNVREFLEQAIRSVELASATLSVEIFVVDNDSSDGSVDMVRSQFPDVQVIANRENTGFSKANNQAIKIANGRYLLILNPDTIIREDTLSSLVDFMDDHPEAGAAGCKILNPDGSFALESRRSFPTPLIAFYRITGLSKLFPQSPRFARYNLGYRSVEEACEVDALSGSCMFVRKEALSKNYAPNESHLADGNDAQLNAGAGLFDEDFFMYGEDLDWCYRIQQAGWKIFYTPDTQIIHYKGESTKKGDLRYVLLFYGAMIRFSEKHFKKRHSWLFRVLLRCGILARGALHVVTNWTKNHKRLLLDLVTSFVIVASGGLLRFAWEGLSFPGLYLGVIAPLYAIATVVLISLQHGYRRRQYTRLIPILLANLGAICFIAATSFFAKGLGFSRIALLVSFLFNCAFLFGIRLTYAKKIRPAHLLRRALLVGDQSEAKRLQSALDKLPEPLVSLVGYVADQKPGTKSTNGSSTQNGNSSDLKSTRWLGPVLHLKDLSQSHEIDDVIFASNALSNQTIFSLIQELRHLSVGFKILSAGQNHLIGHAKIDELNAPALIDAERAFGQPRSTFARRAFEITLVFLGIFLRPFLFVLSKLTSPASLPAVLLKKTKQLPSVLIGSRSLIGYRPEENTLIPKSWYLKPGIFTITDTLPNDTRSPDDLSKAYWLYYKNQSMALDFVIVLRCIKQLKANKPQ